MMCRQNPLLLMEFAVGSLTGEEARRMEEHLSSCVHCRRELDSWRQVEEALRRFPVVEEPIGFRASVMQRIERDYAQSRSLLTRTAFLWIDLAMGIVVSLVASIMAVVALVGLGLEDLISLVRRQEVWGWLDLYLHNAYPNLLVAGWLLTGALAVATLAVVSAGPRRRRA